MPSPVVMAKRVDDSKAGAHGFCANCTGNVEGTGVHRMSVAHDLDEKTSRSTSGPSLITFISLSFLDCILASRTFHLIFPAASFTDFPIKLTASLSVMVNRISSHSVAKVCTLSLCSCNLMSSPKSSMASFPQQILKLLYIIQAL